MDSAQYSFCDALLLLYAFRGGSFYASTLIKWWCKIHNFFLFDPNSAFLISLQKHISKSAQISKEED